MFALTGHQIGGNSFGYHSTMPESVEWKATPDGCLPLLVKWFVTRPSSTRSSTGHKSQTVCSSTDFSKDRASVSEHSKPAVAVTGTPHGDHVMLEVPENPA